MRTITYKSIDLDKVQLNLGFAGENKRTRVIIDCETEFIEYPSAVPYMVVTPPRGEKYPGVISKSGNTVLWDVTDSDLIYDGNGSIQLKFVQGEVVCKTYSAKTKILKADDPTGSTPTPIQNWIDHANEVLETLEQAEIHAPIIDANGYWNIWDADDEQYINTGVRAIGQNGTNGKDGKDGKDGTDATPALITVDYNDLTFPVAKDTLCYHSGLMYQAKQDIPLQEDWTAAHWEVTTVEEQESAIKNDVNTLKSDLTLVENDMTGVKRDILSLSENVDPLTDYFGVLGKTAEGFTTEKIVNPRKITFIGNQYAFANCKVANRKNYHKNDSGTASSDGITINKYTTGFNKINGQSTVNWATEYSLTWASVAIPAGKYRFIIEVNYGESVIAEALTFKFKYKYTGENNYNESTLTFNSVSATSGYIDITFTKEVINLNPRFVTKKTNAYTDLWFWAGLYESDVTIVDTEHTVNNNNTFDYTFDSDNVFEVLDTMQHKSIVEYVGKTESAIPFVTPEMFGAIGDGVVDDTNAVQSCINYAIANRCMAIGKGKYMTKQKITISGDDGVFCFNRLTTPSNINDGYCLEIKGSRNKIDINFIDNTTGKGIIVTHGSSETKNNLIQIRTIMSKYDGITLEGSTSYISYNQFFIGTINSSNGHCVNNKDYASENWFYGGKMICPNGWGFYNPKTIRCFGASFEAEAFGGIYAGNGSSGEFYGCRSVELRNKLINYLMGRSTYNGGTLIKFVGFLHQVSYQSNESVQYQTIDTSECTDCTDPAVYDNPDYAWRPYHNMFHASINKSKIKCQINYGMNDSVNGGFIIGDSMDVFAGKKVCHPAMKSSFEIKTADYDMRDSYSDEDNNLIYPTNFVISVADCVIHLASSYCCEGYNEFIVDQSDATKLCTIYSSYDDQTPIFDGSVLGAGVYRLTCLCDYDSTTDKLPAGWENDYTTTFYTGYNDKWIVEKLS